EVFVRYTEKPLFLCPGSSPARTYPRRFNPKKLMDFRAIHPYSSSDLKLRKIFTMKRPLLLGALLALIATAQGQTRPAAGSPPAAAATTAGSWEEAQARIGAYCPPCHNSKAKVGGLALDNLNVDAVANDAAIWEKAVRKLRGRLMPPPGAKQPEQKEVD